MHTVYFGKEKLRTLFYVAAAAMLLTLVAALSSASAEAATNPIKVKYDDKQLQFSPNPIIDNGTTLVPFRPLFEAMGMSVDWNNERKVVTGKKEGLTIVLTVGSKQATVNGQPLQLSLAPQVRGGSTLVPLRFVGESTGALVAWNPYAPEILIYTDAYLATQGLTKEQANKVIADQIAEFKAIHDAQAAENPPIPVPAAPKGSGVYKPATSDSVDLNNLQGMYYGFRPDNDGSECGGMCWDLYTFLSGKRVVVGTPANGGPETIDCAKDKCSSYTISGGKLTIAGGASYTIERKNGKLFINDVEMERVKPVSNDLKLSGSYINRGFFGLVGISAGSTSWSTTLKLQANGTFSSDSIMIGSVQGGAPTTGAAGASTKGSYRITGNTIVFAYRDGRIERELFFVQSNGSFDDIQIGDSNFLIQ
ncbi:copper amine oxidase N-terminal domain-containing protein [Paenibacillus daejeonensis]|uniref:copper amine oxidase N-terminal domain-containing protein n=1 Tax=Paenibacillus daejeonensis TaxID=135193 RepID=UPI00035DF447|nr:copper amine oxidase N-terminal domain-containing protein [Paenibacillus daejeonensis]